MDANKLKVLRDIQYRVMESCGLCAHGQFPNNDWGTCSVQTYFHLKHQEDRNLSIHKNGYCGRFKLAPDVNLEAFMEFLVR